MSECSNRGHYAKLKNTGCYVPFDPLRRVRVNPPVNCLHNCNGCGQMSMQSVHGPVVQPMPATVVPPPNVTGPVNGPVAAPPQMAASMPAALPVDEGVIALAPEEVEAVLDARRRRRR